MTAAGIDSWYHEKESAWLYHQVAAAEPHPAKAELFVKLAAAAEDQAAKWQLAARRATPAGSLPARVFVPSLRARVVAWLLSRFEPRALRPVLAAMKLRGLSIYSTPGGVAGGHAMPTTLGEVGAPQRSRRGSARRRVRRQRRAGIQHQPGARRRCGGCTQRHALDVLAREELGLNPDDLGSPWRAASTSFVAFAAGAAVPLLPFLLGLTGTRALLTATAITLAALFAVGLGLSLFTGRDAVRSALRMVLIGGGAGAVSFLVGRLLGVVIG